MNNLSSPGFVRTVQEMINALRKAVHDAKPPYEEPHKYMNAIIPLPLTPLEHQPSGDSEGRMLDPVAALRGALHEIEEAQKSLDEGDMVLAMGCANFAAGMLTVCGINLEALEKTLQAA